MTSLFVAKTHARLGTVASLTQPHRVHIRSAHLNTPASSAKAIMQVQDAELQYSNTPPWQPNKQPSPSPANSLPTPIRTDLLARLITKYHDNSYILQGFSHGFSIGYQGPQLSIELKNHNSVLLYKSHMHAKIVHELQLGKIAGPFSEKPFQFFRVNPLGCIPKKEKCSYRMILDLSLPSGLSVNSFIPDSFATVKYESFDTVVNFINSCGPNSLIAKADIQDAFRIIPVHPDDYHLLGYKLYDNYYYDKVLAMGCRSSCQIFERFSSMLQWVLNNVYNVHTVTHVLDDFIFVGYSNDYSCMQGLTAFIALCKYLNIPLKHSKTVHPSTKVIVFGIEIDTVSMKAQLPVDKINKAVALIECLLSMEQCCLHELQQLTGLLNFCCKCIKPGRAFLRRLWNVSSGLRSSRSKMSTVVLDRSAKLDLEAWKLFLVNFNGVRLLRDFSPTSSFHLYSDASSTIGFGAIFGNKWFSGTWEDSLFHHSILVLELVPIVMCFHIFAQIMQNRSIIIHTDNMSLVHILNNQTSHCTVTMHLLRRLVVKMLTHNIHISACHLSSQENLLCDFLSRNKVLQAKAQAPWLTADPVFIPQEFQPSSLLHGC